MRKTILGLIAMLLLSLPGSNVIAETGQSFSSLPVVKQYKIRDMVAPPPTGQRYGPYSTPMYYLFEQGRTYRGSKLMVYDAKAGLTPPNHGNWKLERNRPDWQEVMLKDWAELGLNSTHLLIHAFHYEKMGGTVPASENPPKLRVLTPSYIQALADFVKLSSKYNLKIGVRLDTVSKWQVWDIHPDNPDNVMQEYLGRLREIAALLKGKTAYYILGDEWGLYPDGHKKIPEQAFTVSMYLEHFKQLSKAIKEVDPQAKVSMFAASKWKVVIDLLKGGYAEYGDAVGFNYDNYRDVGKLFAEARTYDPDLFFISNGIGYAKNSSARPRYPDSKNEKTINTQYEGYATEEGHAGAIAKHMFAWWDQGASAAPYYIALRNWVIRGRVYPRWYGFFGFEDFVVDDYGNMTIKRYPGWYAFQTVAHTFYNRKEFKEPAFDVSSSENLSMFRTYEHKLQDGAELVMMLWNDSNKVSTTINIATDEYKYPVRLSLFNYNEWSDVPYEISPEGMRITLKVSQEPIIIRLVRTK